MLYKIIIESEEQYDTLRKKAEAQGYVVKPSSGLPEAILIDYKNKTLKDLRKAKYKHPLGHMVQYYPRAKVVRDLPVIRKYKLKHNMKPIYVDMDESKDIPLQIKFRNIHEVVKFVEEMTGAGVNKNKIYQAMKKGRTYRGLKMRYSKLEKLMEYVADEGTRDIGVKRLLVRVRANMRSR